MGKVVAIPVPPGYATEHKLATKSNLNLLATKLIWNIVKIQKQPASTQIDLFL